MSDGASRIWEATIDDIELVQYDDGDIAIQQNNSITPAFILAPDQLGRLQTILPLLQRTTDPDRWLVGENCVSDRFLIEYAPARVEPYRFGDGSEWLTTTTEPFEQIARQLKQRPATPSPDRE